jgi:hypothetical protein
MTRVTRTLLFAMLVLALATVSAAPVAAGNPHERPYTSRVTSGTSVIFVDDCDLTNFPVISCPQEASSTIIGTHYGQGTSSGTGVAILDFSASCVGRGGLAGTPVTSIIDGVTVGADGDELWHHTVVTGCFVDFTVGIDTEGTGTFVGGTGRFEGATGTTSVVTNVEGEALTSSAVGTISY